MTALWQERLGQTLADSYCGLPLLKLPEDLRVYEHLLWEQAPDVVIEIGTFGGGGALWFLDRLRTLAERGRIERAPRVITVDLDVVAARRAIERVDPGALRHISLLDGDVTDPGLAGRVAGLLEPGSRCFVVEDSAHTYETTAAALRGFARLVPPGGVFVVEDGVVDEDRLRADESWPRGVRAAVEDFLRSAAGADFHVDRDLEVYGFTCNLGGYLRRR